MIGAHSAIFHTICSNYQVPSSSTHIFGNAPHLFRACVRCHHTFVYASLYAFLYGSLWRCVVYIFVYMCIYIGCEIQMLRWKSNDSGTQNPFIRTQTRACEHTQITIIIHTKLHAKMNIKHDKSPHGSI